MPSSNARRAECQRPATEAGDTSAAEGRSFVDAGAGTLYCLGALDEPLLLYRVIVTLAAGEELSDEELGRAYCQLRQLAPLACAWEQDRLLCELLCTAPSSDAAAWRTVDRIRELTDVPLMQVEAGLPGATSPDVVLTSESQWRTTPRQSGDECA